MLLFRRRASSERPAARVPTDSTWCSLLRPLLRPLRRIRLRRLVFMRQVRGFASQFHGVLRDFTRLCGARLKDIPNQLWIFLKRTAALLHGIKYFYQVVGYACLALNAADSSGSAAGINPIERFLVAENLVQVAHRTLVGIAGIGAAHASGIGDHRLELLTHDGFRIAERDEVAVRLRHLTSVGTG